MNDALLGKLKQRNISNNAEKTKKRVNEVWTSANKKSKQELIKFAGRGMYGIISKIVKNGNITAKMTILIARYLNANPFYLIGEADDKGQYSDDFLKDFLIKLGYKKLWNEYSQHIKPGDVIGNEDTPVQNEIASDIIITSDDEKHNIEEQFDRYVKDVLNETADIYEKEQKISVASSNIAAVDDTSEISPETLDIMNKLTEEETITLIRALLIRAKIPNSDSKKLANQIRLKLLLN